MKETGLITEWKSISELREIPRDISQMGYKKEYIERKRLADTKFPYWSNMITGTVNFFEPLEVKEFGENVMWRVNEDHVHADVPEVFETQFGVFINQVK